MWRLVARIRSKTTPSSLPAVAAVRSSKGYITGLLREKTQAKFRSRFCARWASRKDRLARAQPGSPKAWERSKHETPRIVVLGDGHGLRRRRGNEVGAADGGRRYARAGTRGA